MRRPFQRDGRIRKSEDENRWIFLSTRQDGMYNCRDRRVCALDDLNAYRARRGVVRDKVRLLHDRGVQLGRMSNRTCGPFSVSRALRSTLLPGTGSGCNRGVRLEVEPPTITRFFLALLNAQHAVGLLGVMESHPLDGVRVTGSTGAAGDADVQPRQPMKGSR